MSVSYRYEFLIVYTRKGTTNFANYTTMATDPKDAMNQFYAVDKYKDFVITNIIKLV